MAGDITRFRPGSEVPAHLVAGADGAVPERGATLELTGENRDLPEVGAVTAPGNFVATLVEVPPDYDDDDAYAEGEIVGEVTVLVQHYIDWFTAAEDGLTAGDPVIAGTDGVSAASGEGVDPADAVGPVWYSGADGAGTVEKVAVVRQRR